MTSAKDIVESLSLYKIETEMLELIALREDVEHEPEAVAAIDAQIRQYIAAEVRKVDRIAAYIRECETRAETAKAESGSYAAAGLKWQKRAERLIDMTHAVMRSMDVKRLEGVRDTFVRVPTPGAVEIRQTDMVPEKFSKVTITAPLAVWNAVVRAHKKGQALTLADALDNLLSLAVVKSEPSKSAIAKALKANEAVPGCDLVPGEWLKH